MPIPLLLGAMALMAGGLGVKKGMDALADRHKAQELHQSAQALYDQAQTELNAARTAAEHSLQRLGQTKISAWEGQIARFVALFEQIKNVELSGAVTSDGLNPALFSRQDLLQLRDTSIRLAELSKGGTAALGAGALAGLASYAGVTTFAAASTGTAISALSGAAATNATLAWFGGGSLAAGGLGMAGGTLILSSIITGPALAVGGWMLSAQARESLAKAQANLADAQKAAEELKTATALVLAIQQAALEFEATITRLAASMNPALDTLADIINQGQDYARYTPAQKHEVHRAVLFAQVMKLLLETPLLTPEGMLTSAHAQALAAGRNFLNSAPDGA